MKPSFVTGSLLLFGLSVLFLLALTGFESALVGISPSAERAITLLLLVIPALVGAALGAVSLVRHEGRTFLALAGIILNGLFALFHLLLTFFAG